MSIQISYADAQVNLGELCDRVVETGEVVIITRPDGKNVALISEAELSRLLKRLLLLRLPANVARLKTALERSKIGEVQLQAIDELYQRFGFEEDVEDKFLFNS